MRPSALPATSSAIRNSGEAVAHLEAIPKSERTADASGLLCQALASHREELERQTEVQRRWKQAVRSDTPDVREFRPSVVEQVERDPDDEYARERLDLIDRIEVHLENRTQKVRAARKSYEKHDYTGTMSHLRHVHTDLWTEEIEDLYSRANDGRDEAKEICRSLYRGMIDSPLPDLNDPITRLEAISENPAALLREGLNLTQNVRLLRSLIGLAANLANVPDFCTRVVTQLHPELYQALLKEATRTDAPEDGEVLPCVLSGFFNGLINRPLQEIKQHVRAMEPLRHVLQGRDAVQFQRWNDFIDSVDDFEELRSEEWNAWDNVIENERTERLEQKAKQLALTADCVLPTDGDRMAQLLEMLELPSPRPFSLLRRVLRKIRRYLRTRVWKDGTVAVFSIGFATAAAVGILGLSAAGLAGQVGYTLIFGMGDATACLLGGALIGLWTIFGAMLNKLL